MAYRTRQLADADRSSMGTTERQIWERREAWQPARQPLEKLLVAYDWAECFTAVNLVLRAVARSRPLGRGCGERRRLGPSPGAQ